MNELQRLIDSYKESSRSMTEKQLAEAERAIWKAYEASEDFTKNRIQRRAWFSQTLGGSGHTYEHRSVMLAAGEWAEPFWQMLQSGAPHFTVIRLFREARGMAAEKSIDPKVAVAAVLKSYEDTGYMSRTPNGKLFRKVAAGQSRQVEIPKNPPSQPSPKWDMDGSQNSRTKRFLAKSQELAEEYVRCSLADCADIGPLEVGKISDLFVSFMREACEEVRREVLDARANGRRESKHSKVTRVQLRRACEVLGVSVVFGQVPDIDAIRKIMRKRAAQLHPDKHGGSPKLLDEYKAVIASFEVIKDYSEGFAKYGDRRHEAR